MENQIKIRKEITMGQFTGFFVGLLIFAVLNLITWEWIDIPPYFIAKPPLMEKIILFIIYACIMFSIVILGVEKPGMTKLLNDLKKVLTDPTATPMMMISMAKMVLAKVMGITLELEEIQKISEAAKAADVTCSTFVRHAAEGSIPNTTPFPPGSATTPTTKPAPASVPTSDKK